MRFAQRVCVRRLRDTFALHHWHQSVRSSYSLQECDIMVCQG
jgi:hypothetical protein